MQQLIERRRINTRHGFVLRDEAFSSQIDSNFQCGFGGALAITRLQHPKFAALNGEFNILHIAVMFFEQTADPQKFFERIGHHFLK